MSKILLSIPDQLLEKIDSHCQKNDFERSEFLRSLIRKELGSGEGQKCNPKVPTSEPKIKEIKINTKPSVEEKPVPVSKPIIKYIQPGVMCSHGLGWHKGCHYE